MPRRDDTAIKPLFSSIISASHDIIPMRGSGAYMILKVNISLLILLEALAVRTDDALKADLRFRSEPRSSFGGGHFDRLIILPYR